MNTRIIKSILLQVAVIAGVLFVGPFQVNALTISPPRVELQGNPGETIKQDLTLTNDTKNVQMFYSSFRNFEAQGETGNPSFVESKDDLDTWMSTEESVALKPGQSIIVPVTIKIPNNAEPGGHFAAVFWGTAPNTSSGISVSIGAKVGTLILLSVNGDVEEAAGLVDFSTQDNKIWHNTLPVSFVYRFKNDGGDRIKPVGRIVMHDIVYIPESKIDANPGSGNVLPGSTRKFNVDWVKEARPKDYVPPSNIFNKFFSDALYQWKNYAFGPYFAKLNLLYGTNATRVTKTTFFFVFPWQLLICLLVIFVIIFWGGKKLLRRYNRYIIQKARLGMNKPTDATHV